MATTNRYDMVDPAVSRQGRLGLHLEVAALNIDDKVDILRLALKKAYPESESIVDELINIFREQFSSMTTAQIGDAVTRTVTEQAMEKLEQVSTDESDQDENAAQLAVKHFTIARIRYKGTGENVTKINTIWVRFISTKKPIALTTNWFFHKHEEKG